MHPGVLPKLMPTDTKSRVAMVIAMPPLAPPTVGVSGPMVPPVSSPSSTTGKFSTSAPLKETIHLGAQPKQMPVDTMSRVTMPTALPAAQLETKPNADYYFNDSCLFLIKVTS